MSVHELPARWQWPLAARKAHWFPKGEIRSACGGWMFTGEQEQSQTLGEKPGRDDCKQCWKKAKKAQEVTKNGRP